MKDVAYRKDEKKLVILIGPRCSDHDKESFLVIMHTSGTREWDRGVFLKKGMVIATKTGRRAGSGEPLGRELFPRSLHSL